MASKDMQRKKRLDALRKNAKTKKLGKKIGSGLKDAGPKLKKLMEGKAKKGTAKPMPLKPGTKMKATPMPLKKGTKKKYTPVKKKK